MPTLTLSQSFSATVVSDYYDQIDAGAMGGCITVVVCGSGGVRAQHCAGGIQALEKATIFNVGTIQCILIFAPYYAGNDGERARKLVSKHPGVPYFIAETNCKKVDLETLRSATTSETIESSLSE